MTFPLTLILISLTASTLHSPPEEHNLKNKSLPSYTNILHLWAQRDKCSTEAKRTTGERPHSIAIQLQTHYPTIGCSRALPRSSARASIFTDIYLHLPLGRTRARNFSAFHLLRRCTRARKDKDATILAIIAARDSLIYINHRVILSNIIRETNHSRVTH